MAFLTPESTLYQNQYDILIEDTTKNPYMPASKRTSANKALNTNKKNVVPAINELKSQADGLATSTNTAIQKMNTIIGDHSSNVELRQKWEGTGYGNITEAVVDLKNNEDNILENAKKIVSSVTKDVVFMYPKIAENTVSLEQYIPFKGTITHVYARISKLDNEARTPDSGDISLALQKAKNDSITFDDIVPIVISGEAYSKFYDLTETPISVDNEVLKLKVVKYPKKLANLCITVTMALDSSDLDTKSDTIATDSSATTNSSSTTNASA